MKAYRVVLFIIDLDQVGVEGIAQIIENQKFPNHCISPTVKETEEVDIGDWSDDHPLNNPETCEAEYDRLFPEW